MLLVLFIHLSHGFETDLWNKCEHVMMNVDGFYHHEHLSIYRYASIFRGSAVILPSVAESNLIQEVSSTGRGVR